MPRPLPKKHVAHPHQKNNEMVVLAYGICAGLFLMMAFSLGWSAALVSAAGR
ncbi:hypothetical protein KBB27_00900 [Patescibacteria group bacterium]|nr:hypothetical protein [Patescibacteria group bacterium]